MAPPPTRAQPKSRATAPTVTWEAAAPDSPATASAVRNDTSAVASLSRDSPSRMVVSRRGSPIARPTAVAATASGGPTTAPRAKATANGMWSSAERKIPTPSAVKSTRPIDRLRMAARLVRKSTSEVEMAAA